MAIRWKTGNGFFKGNVFTNGGLTSIDNISLLIHMGGRKFQPPKQWDLWYINTYDHTSSSPTTKKKAMHSTFRIFIASTLFATHYNSQQPGPPSSPTKTRNRWELAVPRIISNHGHWKSSSCIGLGIPTPRPMVSPSQGRWSWGSWFDWWDITEAQNRDGFGIKSPKRCDTDKPFTYVYIYISIYIYLYIYIYIYIIYIYNIHINSKDNSRILI